MVDDTLVFPHATPFTRKVSERVRHIKTICVGLMKTGVGNVN